MQQQCTGYVFHRTLVITIFQCTVLLQYPTMPQGYDKLVTALSSGVPGQLGLVPGQ